MTVYVSMMLEQILNYHCYFLRPFYLSSYKTPTLFFLIFQRNLSVSSSFSSLDTASQWLSSHRSLSQDIGWNMWSKKGKLINTEQKTASQVQSAEISLPSSLLCWISGKAFFDLEERRSKDDRRWNWRVNLTVHIIPLYMSDSALDVLHKDFARGFWRNLPNAALFEGARAINLLATVVFFQYYDIPLVLGVSLVERYQL